MQKWIGALWFQIVIMGNGFFYVLQIIEVFRVFGNPEAGQRFDSLHWCVMVHFGAYATEKAPHIGLGWIEHDGVQRSMGWLEVSLFLEVIFVFEKYCSKSKWEMI